MNRFDNGVYEKAYEQAKDKINLSNYPEQERLRHDYAMDAVKQARVARQESR